jgi:hypothetical protein
MVLDQTTLVFGLLVLALVVFLVWVISLELRLKRFLRGKSAMSLEEVITMLGKQVSDTDRTNEEIKQHLISMEERLQHSVQHVKTIRFNPFHGEGQGGNQSFATAFLDEHGNGAVLSTLYARDKVGVYAKPIVKYTSEYELTAEEKESLAK